MSSTTKQETENSPPEWAQPLFEKSANVASKLYKKGIGGNVYQGSTVAPLSDTTMGGVNALNNAGANWDTSGTRGLFAGIGGAATNDPFVGVLSGLAGNVNTNLGPTSSETNLADMASGKWLNPDSNPYGEGVLNKALDDTAQRVKSTMAGAGRAGSNYSLQTLGDTLGDQANAFRYQDYNDNLSRMLGANQQIDSAKSTNYQNTLAGQGLQGSLLSNAADLRGQGLDRAQTAASSMYGIDQQNFQNRLAGANAQLQAGGILDNYSQNMLSDDVKKWYETDNAPWQRLGLLQSAAAGAAGPYGTQSGSSRTSNPLGALGAVGGMFGGK